MPGEEKKEIQEYKEPQLKEVETILVDYLSGNKSINQLKADHDLTTRQLNLIIKNSESTRTKIEKTMLQTKTVRETLRIMDIRDKSLDYLNDTLDDANDLDAETKLKYLNNIASWITATDKVSRLNQGEATDIHENKNINYNMSEILEQLKTPEEKRAYLLEQTRKEQFKEK